MDGGGAVFLHGYLVIKIIEARSGKGKGRIKGSGKKKGKSVTGIHGKTPAARDLWQRPVSFWRRPEVFASRQRGFGSGERAFCYCQRAFGSGQISFKIPAASGHPVFFLV